MEQFGGPQICGVCLGHLASVRTNSAPDTPDRAAPQLHKVEFIRGPQCVFQVHFVDQFGLFHDFGFIPNDESQVLFYCARQQHCGCDISTWPSWGGVRLPIICLFWDVCRHTRQTMSQAQVNKQDFRPLPLRADNPATHWSRYHGHRKEELAVELRRFESDPNLRGGVLHRAKQKEYEMCVDALEECRYYEQHGENSEKWKRQGGLIKYY